MEIALRFCGTAADFSAPEINLLKIFLSLGIEKQ